MSLAVPVIESWDGEARRIYLKQGVETFHWIDDIYIEYRNWRRTVEDSRKWEPLLKADGNQPKGGGKYTPRYVTMLLGARVVPFDENILINVTGEAITDNADIDPDPFDTTTRTQPLKLYITPPASELVRAEAEIAAVNRMSYNERVYLDVNSGISGTDGLKGNQEYPVDNMVDAVAIADRLGIYSMYFLTSFAVNSGSNLNGFLLQGRSHVNIELDILDAALVENVTIHECILSGVLDGNTDVRFSVVNTIHYMNGHIHDSGLGGLVVLGGAEPALFDNCRQLSMTIIPEIDMNVGGQNLICTNYSGKLKLSNLNDPTVQVGVGLNTGALILDWDVTQGMIQVAGDGDVIDMDGNHIHTGTWNGGVTIINNCTNKKTIAEAVLSSQLTDYEELDTVGNQFVVSAYGGKVYIDSVNGVSGQQYPIGTSKNPVNNVVDAQILIGKYNLTELVVTGALTVPFDMSCDGMIISGTGNYTSNITIEAGATFNHCRFINKGVTGVVSGIANYDNCRLENLSGINGKIDNCILVGNNSLADDIGDIQNITNCRSESADVWTSLDIGNNEINLTKYFGLLQVMGKNGIGSSVLHATLGFFHVLDTCVSGTITVSGRAQLIDESDAGCIIASDYLFNTDIQAEKSAESVWDSILTGATHNIPTSAGRRLRAMSSVVITEDDVISATINTITLNGSSSDIDGAYDPALISITEGAGYGQSRMILEYDGLTHTAVVDRDWKELPDATSTYIITSSSGREHINEGLIVSATANTMVLNTNASPYDGAYTGQIVFIRSGTGADQACKINGYIGVTRTITLCDDLFTVPDNTSAYVILPSGMFKKELIADGILNANLPDFTDINTVGKALNDLLLAGGSLTVEQTTQLAEVHKLLGAKIGSPLITNQDTMTVDDIVIDITGDPATETTLTRQP